MTPDPIDSSNPLPRAAAPALWACATISATLVALIALGHDGWKVVQLMALAAPVIALLLWPVRARALHCLRSCVVWLWAMAFALDGVVRAYLWATYQAAPDSSLVLSSSANTTGRELAEYVSMQWPAMGMWLAVLLLAAWVCQRSVRHGARQARHWPRAAWLLLCALLVISSAAYASKPWRRWHPLLFWPQWSESVEALHAGWADLQQERERTLRHAAAAKPVIVKEGPATVVLVIADSINRDNMALYGYPRATTPQLLAQKASLQDQMLVLRNAWSADASTLPSLRNMFSFGLPQAQQPQHVLALARAAGYKVWWISNHDDVAIEQGHARLANVVEMVNREPGRAGASLDGELLDCVQEALEDTAERKLIVVHLLGAHPHYSLRFPGGANPFDDLVDAVEEELEQRGRSMFVRRFRKQYDAAILYHDSVVARTLALARQAGRGDPSRAWMYLSDHGQEVGHGGNHAGHSPATASGYRIPAMIWRNGAGGPFAPDVAARPFRADWAGWTLADLLNMRWDGSATDRNVLRDGYRWEAPPLPIAVDSFVD